MVVGRQLSIFFTFQFGLLLCPTLGMPTLSCAETAQVFGGFWEVLQWFLAVGAWDNGRQCFPGSSLIRRCNINCTQRKVDRDVYRPPTKRQNALRAPTGKTKTSSYLTFEWPVVRFLGLCPKWCRVTSPADTTLNKGSSSYYFGWRAGWWKIASLTQEDVFLQQPGRNGWGEMRFIIHPENAYAVIAWGHASELLDLFLWRVLHDFGHPHVVIEQRCVIFKSWNQGQRRFLIQYLQADLMERPFVDTRLVFYSPWHHEGPVLT